MIALATWRVGGRRRSWRRPDGALAADCLGIARRACASNCSSSAPVRGWPAPCKATRFVWCHRLVTDFALMVSFLVAALIGGRD